MSFRLNPAVSENEKAVQSSMSANESKSLRKSDFYRFGNRIFSDINEERFKVLYSSNKASRPNTPVNEIIAALILKEMKHRNDEDVCQAICMDPGWRYALHLLPGQAGSKRKSCQKGISIRTLRRFRAKCIQYQAATGKDLIREEFKELAQKACQKLHINQKTLLMDSFMCNSNIKDMMRLEIVYTVVSNMVRELNRSDHVSILDGCANLQRYLKKGNHNRVLYRSVERSMQGFSVQ